VLLKYSIVGIYAEDDLIIEERLQKGKPQVCDAGISLYSRAAKRPEAGSLKCCQKYT
jgi:hypothetical protein